MSSNHPLPPAPGQHQQGRPRAKSSFSFRSNHSHKSSQGSGHKVILSETHDEKEAHRLTTKADPTLAMNEAEPAAVALQKNSLASIRAIQHRDAFGNPIADPDRSNPTRSRWERPLDTIRGFEAAIDGNYSKKSYMRSESTVSDNSQFNRRSSYYGGTQITVDERPRYGQGGYYGGSYYGGGYYGGGGRASSYRPDSSYMQEGRGNGMTRAESYYNNGVPDGAGPSHGYYSNRVRYPRTASEPHFNNGGVYPPNGNQHSYETVTTASGSGGSSGEPAGYTTDPSSDDSADRFAPMPTKDPAETYGIGFGNAPQYEPPGASINVPQYGPNGAERQGNGYPNQGNGYQNQAPAVSRKEIPGPRVPIKLGTGGGPAVYEAPRPADEKRKSWFGRRLSKNK